MGNKKREDTFRFKQFSVANRLSAMKVGTDGVLLGAWCDVDECHTVLDVGCGTGLIALMVAQRNPCAAITGIDIDDDACTEAIENASNSPWADRIKIMHGDFRSAVNEHRLSTYDLIVSNPPFFSTDTRSPENARAAARHGIGLNVEIFLRYASSLLNPHGRIALITPAEREADVRLEASLAALHIEREVKVYTKAEAKTPVRMLWQFRNFPVNSKKGSLVIGSPEYKRLVEDFYL